MVIKAHITIFYLHLIFQICQRLFQILLLFYCLRIFWLSAIIYPFQNTEEQKQDKQRRSQRKPAGIFSVHREAEQQIFIHGRKVPGLLQLPGIVLLNLFHQFI